MYWSHQLKVSTAPNPKKKLQKFNIFIGQRSIPLKLTDKIREQATPTDPESICMGLTLITSLV
jgi:hypothetical protein